MRRERAPSHAMPNLHMYTKLLECVTSSWGKCGSGESKRSGRRVACCRRPGAVVVGERTAVHYTMICRWAVAMWVWVQNEPVAAPLID